MISAKNLSEEQVTAIRQWAEDGSQLADIQKRLKGQFGLNVTYMDTRFVVLDLGIDIEAEGSEEDTEPPAEPVEAEVQVAEDESLDHCQCSESSYLLPQQVALASGDIGKVILAANA